jgi:hypothetical protein
MIFDPPQREGRELSRSLRLQPRGGPEYGLWLPNVCNHCRPAQVGLTHWPAAAHLLPEQPDVGLGDIQGVLDLLFVAELRAVVELVCASVFAVIDVAGLLRPLRE